MIRQADEASKLEWVIVKLLRCVPNHRAGPSRARGGFVHRKQAWGLGWHGGISSLSEPVHACRTAHVCYILVSQRPLDFHQLGPCAVALKSVLV
jgi:hypothetical protein